MELGAKHFLLKESEGFIAQLLWYFMVKLCAVFRQIIEKTYT